MIIDDKSAMLSPPPPYVSPDGPPPFPGHRRDPATLSMLPPHLLLEIVYMTFPQTSGFDEGKLERQRKTLYWLSVSLRLVNRSFYLACMHVLRSTYLPAYDALIRSPYSSDPFPATSAHSPSSPSSIQTIQRETTTLDLFIALKVREDVWMDDSELHLERDESFKDLFDLLQPKSRLEDLVRVYGVREGVVSVEEGSQNAIVTSSTPSTPTAGVFRLQSHAAPTSSTAKTISAGPTSTKLTPVPFTAISVAFSSRKVGLVLTTSGKTKRTIVEVSRERDERLELAAKRLVGKLRKWLEG